MESITNQTNIEANVAVINDYESWEERADDDESSIDDDTLSTMSSVGEVVVPIVAGAKVSDISFPLPGTKTKTSETRADWGEVKGRFNKKEVKERFVVGSSSTNEERSRAFEMLEDKKKGDANLVKTKMCRSTETGEACPHGERCRFAHTLSELRISECFFGDRCRFVRCHRSHEGVYFNNTGKFCNHLHPGETHECFFKRTGKDMPVVVPPKNVETKVVDISKNDGKNDDKNSVWVPKPKLVYKQPSREEIEELQMKRLAELEEQRQESEANKLADELDGIIREGIKGIETREEKVKVREEKVKVREEPVREEPVREKELVLRVSATGYLAALEMAMKSGRTNLRVEIV